MAQDRECVYCGRRADSREHVPPRLLLEKPYPENLRTLPACRACNQGFSLDEQYFLVLLGQIATSSKLAQKIEPGGVLDRALTRAPALDERVVSALEVDDDGRVVIRPEHDRVQRVIAKVAHGLYVLRYRRNPRLRDVEPIAAYPYNLKDQRPPDIILGTYSERFRPKRWIHVQPRIFSYVFVRRPGRKHQLCCIMDFHETLWGVACLPPPQKAPTSPAQMDLPLHEES